MVDEDTNQLLREILATQREQLALSERCRGPEGATKRLHCE
jgi:hypothetical protein